MATGTDTTPPENIAPSIDPKFMIGVRNGAFDGTDLDDLKALVAASRGRPMVVQIHGGLVEADNAIKNSHELVSFYLDAGAYPVFPIWHTGFLETVTQDWQVIAKGLLADLIFKKVQEIIKRLLVSAPPAVEVDSLSGDSQAIPDNWQFVKDHAVEYASSHPDPALEAEFQRVIAEETPNSVMELGLSRSREKDLLNPRLLPNATALSVEPDSIVSLSPLEILIEAGEIAVAIADRFIKGSDHGVKATIWEEILRKVYVAEIGEKVWQEMSDASAKNCLTTAPIGEFFTELKNDGERDLYLVGHSAGAIMTCDILDLLFGPGGLNWSQPVNIVFLAPAVTMARFEKTLDSHSQNIANFRMFTMHDALESADTLLKGVEQVPEAIADFFYPSSLLYFISGLLDNSVDEPLVGMERFYWTTAKGTPKRSDKVVKFINENNPNGSPRVAFSIDDGPDEKLRTNSIHHGGFGSLTLNGGSSNTTMQSIFAIVKSGVF